VGAYDRGFSGQRSEKFMPVIVKRSKRYKKAMEKAVTAPVAVDAAITAVKAFPATKFDQSVERDQMRVTYTGHQDAPSN